MFLYWLIEQTEQTISQKLLMSAKQIFIPGLNLRDQFLKLFIVFKQTDRSELRVNQQNLRMETKVII